jgi:F-type H+-transporting ATPase subunit b
MHLLIGFIIAQIIIFAAVILILKRLIFQDTTSAVNRLTKLDNLNREKERQLATRLEETERLLREKKEEMAKEEARMKMEAERSAIKLHEDIVLNAKKEAEEIVKKAIAAREKMQTDAAIAAESRMVDFCKQLLLLVLTPVIDEKMNQRLIDEFLVDLQKVDTTIVSKLIRQVDIFTAKKLGEETGAVLKTLLGKKLERDIDLKFHEDPALVGGIILKFGTLVIDDSLLERLNTAAAQFKETVAFAHTKVL